MICVMTLAQMFAPTVECDTRDYNSTGDAATTQSHTHTPPFRKLFCKGSIELFETKIRKTHTNGNVRAFLSGAMFCVGTEKKKRGKPLYKSRCEKTYFLKQTKKNDVKLNEMNTQRRMSHNSNNNKNTTYALIELCFWHGIRNKCRQSASSY